MEKIKQRTSPNNVNKWDEHDKKMRGKNKKEKKKQQQEEMPEQHILKEQKRNTGDLERKYWLQ